MNNLYSFGICPCCLSKFDVKTAIPSFCNSFPGKNIKFVYGLCLSCFDYYSESPIKNQSKIRIDTRENFFSNPSDEYSIVDSLSFEIHNWNFFNAWLLGCGLPEYIQDGINDGSIDGIVIFPSMAEVHHE